MGKEAMKEVQTRFMSLASAGSDEDFFKHLSTHEVQIFIIEQEQEEVFYHMVETENTILFLPLLKLFLVMNLSNIVKR